MNLENVDLSKLAAGEEPTENQEQNSDQELLLAADMTRHLIEEYAKDPSIANVISEELHKGIETGPPATAENTERLTNGKPALYLDGRQWYKAGNEPEGWVRGTVELPDGRLLNPLQAVYIIIRYNQDRLTDEQLLTLFILHYDEAVSLGDNPIEATGLLKETQEAVEEVEEPSAPLLPKKKTNEELKAEIAEANSPTGVVIEKPKHQKAGELDPERLEEVESYIENMDQDYKDAEEMRKKMAEINPTVASAEEVAEIHGAEAVVAINNNIANLTGNEDAKLPDDVPVESLLETAESDPREETEKRLSKFNEVIISIDKVNSSNLEFTAEERAKIEVVDKIKIAEVEMVDIQSLRRRKAKTGAVDTLLKRRGNTSRSFNMLIPASGYVATMGGCSLHELMNLINEGNDPVQSYLMRWTIVHSKLITTTIGDMPDFNYFMKHTADSDLNAFIYAIMVASLPSNDSITLTCNEEKCRKADGEGTQYEFPYTVRSLLRIEEFDDAMIERLGEISTASTTLEAATEVHNNSLVMTSKAVRLPDTHDVIEIQVPSAYDFVERTLKNITNNDNIKPEHGRSAITASRVNAVLIDNGEGDYIEVTDPVEIVKYIYSMSPREVLILESLIDKHTSNNSFNFGLVDITCPNCKSHTEVLPIDISELLFIRNAKVAETIVE